MLEIQILQNYDTHVKQVLDLIMHSYINSVSELY